jgi:hypothetical protein
MSFGIPTRNGLPLGLGSVMSFAFAPDLLVSPGAITSPLTLTRAQTGGAVATGQPLDWQTYSADTPRFVAPNGGLLIEGQRTNSIRNPRFVGGAPGVVPTNMVLTVSSNGISAAIDGIGTEYGLPYIDITLTGTATATSFINLMLEGTQAIAATVGQSWAVSAFNRALSVIPDGCRVRLDWSERNASGVVIAGQTGSLTTPESTLNRFSSVFTNGAALTAFGVPAIVIRSALGVTHAGTTIRFYAPQAELGAFASTPILPPIDTPGASTRGADLVSASLSDLGVGGNGACTVLWTGRIPQNAPASADQAIFQLDTGATTDRHFVFNAAGGATIQLVCQVSGSTVGSGTAGTMTAGTLFRLGLSADGAGRVALCFNGATPVAVTGAASSALTRLLVGTGTGSDEMFGETTRFIVLPQAMPDAELQAAVAAFPSP